MKDMVKKERENTEGRQIERRGERKMKWEEWELIYICRVK